MMTSNASRRESTRSDLLDRELSERLVDGLDHVFIERLLSISPLT